MREKGGLVVTCLGGHFGHLAYLQVAASIQDVSTHTCGALPFPTSKPPRGHTLSAASGPLSGDKAR